MYVAVETGVSVWGGWMKMVHDSLQREQKKQTTNIKKRKQKSVQRNNGRDEQDHGWSIDDWHESSFSYLADRFVFRPASPGRRQGTPRSCCRLSASLQSPLQISNVLLRETPRDHSHNQSIRCTRIRDSFYNHRHDTTSLYANRLMADGSEE
jgi:hypothetical protein